MRKTSRALLVSMIIVAAAAGYLLGSATGADTPVWQADEAFNRALGERNSKAFSSWIDEDAVFLGSGLLQGREAILEQWSPLFDRESGYTLSWQPHTAVLSKCEDLGYTLGDFAATAPGLDGEPVRSVGTYLSVWRRGPDRAWRVVADAGTPPEVAAGD